ncbi:MAG: triple tyrosine motif-containing protein, partial [Bacteroidota bacterium]
MSKGLNGRYGISVCLIACLFIGFLKLDAQRVRNYSFDHLTVDDGLSQSSNDFIFQDSQGFVWLSSTDGLNRFDGKDVSVYKSISGDTTSLLGNIITSNFFEDRQKNIWFTTDEGIHCYIRAKDHFRQFQLTTEEAKLLSANYYAFHLEDKKLWVRVGSGNQGKLFLFDISTHTHEVIIHLKGQRNYVVRNELDKIVSARLDTGMLIQTIQKPYQEEFFFKNGTIASVYHVDLAAADTWYLSSNIGMILFHYDERNFEIFNTYRNTPIGEVYYTTSINDSILLVATELQSVLIFNKKSQLFTKKIPFEPEKKRGLHLSRVNTLHKDISNNIWFTSRSSGPNYSNLDKWKFDLPSELRDQHIVTLFESNSGDIFCSHGNGSVFFSKQNNKPIKTSILLPPNERQERISHFLEKEGHIWAFTYSHLLKWNSEEYHYSYVCNLPASLLFPFKSRTNDIWLSTYGKELFELKIERDTVRFEKGSLFNAYNSSYITVIYEDRKKQKYLALDASRLVVLNDKGEEIKEVKGIGYAKAFYEEDNLLWVATTTGILTINTTTLDVNFLNEQNGGLPNEAYYCIIPDEQNNFWLSSNKGIVRYNRNTKTYHRYTLADGLQGNEYNTNAFLKTQDGEIWMGGTNGLNRFYPEQIKSEIPLAKVQFTRLQINDEPAPDSVNITMTEELALACSDNTLSFDFVGIDYSDPENVQLKYQMLGNDEDWIAAVNDGFARYSNLSFGNYTFQVKAANSDGIWSDEIKQ